jgi:TRAP-type uncharacterized transport system substrate-binding protein
MVLCRAIAQVTRQKYPRLDLQVLPSRGLDENLQLLDEGKADLILSISNLPIPDQGRVVARLMPAVLQILVRKDSGIESPADLQGRKVLVQNKTSISILQPLLSSFGIDPRKIYFLVYSGSGNEYWKYLSTEITSVATPDAIELAFTPGNPYISKILERVPSRFLALPNAKALAMLNPGLVPYTIPKGLYEGNPVLPEQDLQTVAAYRLLLARETVDPGIVRNIVSILSEDKNDLVNALPNTMSYLKVGISDIRIPSSNNEFGPLHPGVVNFNNREHPSLLRENVSIFSFGISFYVFFWSQWNEFKRRRYKRKLLQVDALLAQLQDLQLRIMTDLERGAAQHENPDCWHTYQQELLQLMADMTELAQNNRLKPEDLALFRSLWNALHGSVAALLRSRLTRGEIPEQSQSVELNR